MDRRVLIAIGILAGAAFGYYMFNQRKASGSNSPPAPDQGPAEAAMANYTAPPSYGIQANQPGQTFVNNSQAMPYPYNT
jgi:hypothetical protein